MAEQITNHRDDSEFRDDTGPIFHSNLHGVHMRSTHTTIMAGIQQGDPVAQERFMRRYGDPSRCYYEAKTGKWGFDRDTAKELAEKVLVKLCLEYKLHSYQHIPGKTRFRSYLFAALDAGAIDYLRKKKTDILGEAELINVGQEPIGMPADIQLPEAKIHSEQAYNEKRRRTIMVEAIKMVKTREAEGNPEKGSVLPFDVDILIWMECEDRSSPEIAAETGLTDNAVRARARAARMRLREAIREILREEEMTEDEIDDEIADLCW